MTKELSALKEIGNYRISEDDYCVKDTNDYDIVETALKRLNYIDENKIYCISENYLQDINKIKALEIIKNNFKLVGNCLHAKNSYAEDGWVFVKEIEDEEELEAWKGILL